MADRCACGAVIVQPATGRRRKRCTTCTPTRDRPARKAPVLALAERKPDPEKPKAEASRSLFRRTLAELEAAGRAETWQADAALKIAELIDAGGYTAQGAVALIEGHRRALDVAMAGAQRDADVIDMIFGQDGAG